ncbi:MAG: cupin domain-containing protein [Defluviitaleaceae bacterium]|nr:cupin domain-containing protein [Defluviitaleaceae bacterium]
MTIITPDNILRDANRPDGITMNTAFAPAVTGKNVSMGSAAFPPGARVPVEGSAAHAGDEYSYIISGSLCCVCNGQEFTVSAGDFAFIPAGMAHYSYNPTDREAEVIWVLAQ